MVKYSHVACGECQAEALFVVCEWPPSFYFCRECLRVFTIQPPKDGGLIWQLKGYPQT